ncbi:MAG: hypothetical protein GOV15_01615, partial [Candidatus Diapherotrites archaeon]|nr:hypothetical protein [Candidatus Diapherotrites archaeon]
MVNPAAKRKRIRARRNAAMAKEKEKQAEANRETYTYHLYLGSHGNEADFNLRKLKQHLENPKNKYWNFEMETMTTHNPEASRQGAIDALTRMKDGKTSPQQEGLRASAISPINTLSFMDSIFNTLYNDGQGQQHIGKITISPLNSEKTSEHADKAGRHEEAKLNSILNYDMETAAEKWNGWAEEYDQWLLGRDEDLANHLEDFSNEINGKAIHVIIGMGHKDLANILEGRGHKVVIHKPEREITQQPLEDVRTARRTGNQLSEEDSEHLGYLGAIGNWLSGRLPDYDPNQPTHLNEESQDRFKRSLTKKDIVRVSDRLSQLHEKGQLNTWHMAQGPFG